MLYKLKTAWTPALCLLLALGVCASADDFDFIYIPYNANPEGWSSGDPIPESVRDSLFVLLFDEATDGVKVEHTCVPDAAMFPFTFRVRHVPEYPEYSVVWVVHSFN